MRIRNTRAWVAICLVGASGLTIAQDAADAAPPDGFVIPYWQLAAALIAIGGIGLFVWIKRRLQERDDARKEALFEAHQRRQSLRSAFEAELKEAVARSSAEDLSFVVLRRLLAHVKKLYDQRGAAALVKFADGDERLVSPDPRMQAEFEAMVSAHETALKSVSRTGNPVVLQLRAEVGRWTAQTLAALPIPVPDPGYGMLVISRAPGLGFSPDELEEAAQFAQLAIDSMEVAKFESTDRSDREIDKLTQVFNRPAIELRAQNAFTEASKERKNVSALFIQVDGYREFVKDHSQEKADVMLKTIAQRIQRALERNQFVGRIDGPDFLVVLPDVPEFQALKLGDTLCKAIAREFPLPQGGTAQVTASIGVAAKFPSDTNNSQLLERAVKGKDQARYQGGNVVRKAGDDASGGMSVNRF
jgi:diguanylate cyclase (GGDEF)-like protein